MKYFQGLYKHKPLPLKRVQIQNPFIQKYLSKPSRAYVLHHILISFIYIFLKDPTSSQNRIPSQLRSQKQSPLTRNQDLNPKKRNGPDLIAQGLEKGEDGGGLLTQEGDEEDRGREEGEGSNLM